VVAPASFTKYVEVTHDYSAMREAAAEEEEQEDN
jgi:hypothetical protein